MKNISTMNCFQLVRKRYNKYLLTSSPKTTEIKVDVISLVFDFNYSHNCIMILESKMIYRTKTIVF